MNQPADDRPPLVIAMEWASTVVSVALEMVLPGLFGYWLDRKLGTVVVFVLLGFSGGMVLAVWHLLKLASRSRSRDNGSNGRPG